MTTKPTRVLPADVYDTLELAALAFGGIGGGQANSRMHTPYCAHGLAWFAADSAIGAVSQALFRVGIAGPQNDDAVEDINSRKGRRLTARVPFTDWCAELGVERGQ